MKKEVMSIEAKAKAYDEALEKVKPLYKQAKKDNCPIWSVYEDLFPQLNESEDERIRKALIEVFKKKLEKGFEWVEYGIPNRSVLDWLEKQKEQREATPETCLKGIFDFDDIFQLELAVDCYKEKKGRAYPVTVKHQHEVLMKLYDLIGIDREALDQDEEDETD